MREERTWAWIGVFVVDSASSLKCKVCFRSPRLCTKIERSVVSFLIMVFDPSVDGGIRTVSLNCARWRLS